MVECNDSNYWFDSLVIGEFGHKTKAKVSPKACTFGGFDLSLLHICQKVFMCLVCMSSKYYQCLERPQEKNY